MQSSSSPWFRTRERVEAAAEAAGLKCQVNGVQILEFGQDLNSQDLKLMELNDDIVEELSLGRRYSRRCLSGAATTLLVPFHACDSSVWLGIVTLLCRGACM